MSEISHCPICGFELPHPIDDEELRNSCWICSCCGVEFGCDDTPDYRDEWVRGGARWFNESRRPAHWDLQDQLHRARLDWNA